MLIFSSGYLSAQRRARDFYTDSSADVLHSGQGQPVSELYVYNIIAV